MHWPLPLTLHRDCNCEAARGVVPMQPGLLGPFPPAAGSGETAAIDEPQTVLVVPCPR